MILRRTAEVNFPSDLVKWGLDGLTLLREPTLEEWQQLHYSLSICGKTHQRWMADSRRYGRRFFGDDAVEQWESQLELAMPELKAMDALERMETRQAGLRDEHHLVLAKRCTEEADREKWAAVAAENKLSPVELQLSIEAGEVVRKGEGASLNAADKSVGLVTIEGVAMKFELWLRKVKETGFPEDWDDERLSRVADLLSLMVEVYRECSARVDEQNTESK